MRHCSFLIQFCGVLFGMAAHGQFGNEWINFNQTYYKITVAKKGIYKLTYNDLAAAGVPLGSIDTRRIQIFRRGAEQSIRFNAVQTPDNNTFDAGEYIEFYGDKNDGATDVDLYKNPAHHPHPYYNLYSDTAAYFLTWNLGTVLGKRMVELAPETGSGNPEEGFINSVLLIQASQYSEGVLFNNYVSNSFFDEGEGWTGPIICTVNGGCIGFRDYTLILPHGAPSLPPPQLEVMLVGRDVVGHAAEIYAGPDASNLHLVGTSGIFQNFQNSKVTGSLNWTDVASNGAVVVRIKVLGVGGVRESLSVSYLKIDYFRDFDFTGVSSQTLTLTPKSSGRSAIEISNALTGLRLFDVTDLQAIRLIGTQVSGATVSAVISNTNTSREIYATSRPLTPTIEKISFQSLRPTSNNFIIISHEILRRPALDYSDPVEAYAAYRASAAGGGYDTVVVNASQLYNQFNYGETSPRAIYQFLKYMDKGSADTRYLFIIGKGLEIHVAYDRQRPLKATDLQDLVPTAGYPGSDLTFSFGLRGTTLQPGIPTGRLVATTPNDVAVYLNKIKETEALPFDNLWRKNILHLSGGINPGEPETFRYYVDGFKPIAEDIYMGAKVETKSKKTFDLETIPVPDQVNAGLSLITFFGHSTTEVLDFEIGYVTNPLLGYNNKGKYPAFLINGCSVGRIFDNRTGTKRSFGEDWMLAADRGAKAFIAHSSYGFEPSLREYSELFYQSVFGDSVRITQGVGDAQIRVGKILLSQNTIINNLSVVQQMVLMGDPAVPVFGAGKPDYAIQNEFLKEVSLDGNPITVASATFGIKYKIRNYGQARPNPISVRLTRTFADNSTVTHDTIVAPVPYESEFVFVLPRDKNLGGQNSLTITIDSAHELAELNEENNQASLSLFIPFSSTHNLSPYAYSIVNSPSVDLVFQNTNQFPAQRDYQIELDTVSTFTSGFLIQKKIHANVLGRTTVTLAGHDSTVYYWRTRLDNPLPTESNDWFTTSFTYLSKGGEGWAQLRNQQLSENTFSSLAFSTETGDFTFPGTTFPLFVRNFGSANPTDFTNTSFRLNNEELNLYAQGQGCRNNSLNLVAFDKTTGNPYAPIPFKITDPRTCGKEPEVINNFILSDIIANANGLAAAITSAAISDSIVLFTMGDPGVQKWTNAVVTTLGDIGVSAAQLANFQVGEPMIIFGRKGSSPGTATVIRATTTPLNEQELVVNKTITARPTSGTLRSATIGPAQSWSKLYRRVDDVSVTDGFIIRIIGISDAGVEQILYAGNGNAVDLSFINSSTFPSIHIELQATDEVSLTPVDLKNWIVQFTPVAEGILLLRSPVNPIIRNEGQSADLNFSFVNVSPYEFLAGTLDAQLKVVSQATSHVAVQTMNILAPQALDSTLIHWQFGTSNQNGVNDINASVNNFSVPEQNYFNNKILLNSYLQVIRDILPPVLDVTVDGRYLVNGDVVSPHPRVQIKIIDESYYNPKTDTVGIEMGLRNMDTNEVRRINFSNPDLSWRPATPDLDFTISFTTSLSPGQYELSVLGVDASGNPSGLHPYSISFFVTDELSVQLGDPFPNPSTGTFMFPVHLGGNELPQSMSMKIFSVDGRMVKHFDLNDVPGLYIGTNYLRWNAVEGSEYPIQGCNLFFYKLELSVSGKRFSKTGRLLLLK